MSISASSFDLLACCSTDADECRLKRFKCTCNGGICLIKFPANMAQNGSDDDVAAGQQQPWFDLLKFLPVERQLFDPKTEELNRDGVGSRVFHSARSAYTFDLCTTTIATMQRMHMKLVQVWAANHPLLRDNVRLTRANTQFRLFHEYSMDTVRKALFAEQANSEFLQRFVKEKQRIERDIAASEADMNRVNEKIVMLRGELASLRADIQQIERQIEARDSGLFYLSRLQDTKRERLRIMENESEIFRAWLRDGKYQDYTRYFEERLNNALNDSIYQIVRLRDQLQQTPNLFAGNQPRRIVGGVLPIMQAANLPKQLMPLYLRLYRNLSEASIREILMRQFVDSRRDAD